GTVSSRRLADRREALYGRREAGLSFDMSRLVSAMKLRPGALLLFAGVAGLTVGPALSQTRPMSTIAPPAPVANHSKAAIPVTPGTASPAPRTPDAPIPGNPDYK